MFRSRNDLKNELLYLIKNDRQIIKEIKQIFSENYSEQADDSEKLKRKLKRRTSILKRLINAFRNKKKENEKYESQFNNLTKIHNKYMELSEKSKNSLSGIFKDTTVLGILSCGIQSDNLNSLWDYIKDELKNENFEDAENLKFIFEELFKIYILSNSKYKFQEVKKDDSFDSESYIRHCSGKVSGKIEEVIFLGYINEKNGEIIKKTLVKVY